MVTLGVQDDPEQATRYIEMRGDPAGGGWQEDVILRGTVKGGDEGVAGGVMRSVD